MQVYLWDKKGHEKTLFSLASFASFICSINDEGKKTILRSFTISDGKLLIFPFNFCFDDFTFFKGNFSLIDFLFKIIWYKPFSIFNCSVLFDKFLDFYQFLHFVIKDKIWSQHRRSLRKDCIYWNDLMENSYTFLFYRWNNCYATRKIWNFKYTILKIRSL